MDGSNTTQEINEEDERVLSSFMRAEVSTRQTLADIVLQKLQEQERIEEDIKNTPLETAAFSQDSAPTNSSPGAIHPKVAAVYKKYVSPSLLLFSLFFLISSFSL